MSSVVPLPEQPGPPSGPPGPYPAGPGPYPAGPGPYPAGLGPYPAGPGPYPAPYPLGPPAASSAQDHELYQRYRAQGTYQGAPLADPRSAARTGFATAFAATALWAGAALGLLLLLAGPPASAEAAGYAVGALLFPALVAAVPTWLIVRRRPGGWPFWQVALVGLGFFVLVRLFAVAGAAGS